MGCFESKEQVPVGSNNAKSAGETARPSGKPSVVVHSATERPEVVSQHSASNREQNVSNVVAVPRPEVVVGERERAELKVKNMRDKLVTNITLSEEVMREDALLALKMKQEGKLASARVLLRKRKLSQSRIEKSETMLKRVMDMIDSIDTAADNAKFLAALEQGTAAINEITKDLSAERVHNALTDRKEAVDYVNYIGKVLEEEEDTMTDEQIEGELSELAKEFETSPKEQRHEESVEKIPDVPTEQPVAPQPATVENEEEHAVAV